MKFAKLTSALLLSLVVAYAGEGEAAPKPDPIVFITKSGTKFHAEGCRYLSKSKIEVKLSEALKNHTPCSVCNPPKK